VADAATSLAALVYGGLLGAVSAVLLVQLCTRLAPEALTPLQLAAVGLLAWLPATWFLSRNAGSLLIVFRRAFALAALQWGSLSLVATPEPVASASTGVGLSRAAGPFSGDAALIMALVCVAAWALCRWSSPSTSEGKGSPA